MKSRKLYCDWNVVAAVHQHGQRAAALLLQPVHLLLGARGIHRWRDPGSNLACLEIIRKACSKTTQTLDYSLCIFSKNWAYQEESDRLSRYYLQPCIFYQRLPLTESIKTWKSVVNIKVKSSEYWISCYLKGICLFSLCYLITLSASLYRRIDHKDVVNA